MRLRETIYRMSVQIKQLVPVFHKSHIENLVLMIVGIAHSRSVQLPRIAEHAPVKKIQIESRVQRFERLLACRQFIPLDVMQPVATQVLKHLSRSGEPLMILMDRTMINDGLNLLYVSVGFCGRALPLGWREVPHQGNSDLALQKKLLGWLKECLPQGVEVFIVADREFHSIHLAGWIKLEMGVHFVLRIKAGTWIEIDGQWCRAGEMASIGERRLWKDVRVTRDRKVEYRVNLLTVWERTEDEPWLLISDADEAEEIEGVYKKRYWIEEMFSDHKRRGMNLEATRITDPKRVQRLLVAVALAYLWTMEIGALVVNTQQWRRVDNRGAKRSVSLCQVGLRWLREMLMQSLLPPAFTGQFRPVADG